MEQLIDLLLRFIVSNKTICKDIKETISEISSEDISEENLLAYYNTIPSEEMSLIYACLAKILNLKEYLLYKDIEKIAKTWDEIQVGTYTFNVPYVLGGNSVEKYKTSVDFKNELIELLKSICTGVTVQTTNTKYDTINTLLDIIVKDKVTKTDIEPKINIKRKGGGKSNCQVLSQIAELIYKEWDKSEKKIPFLDLFNFTYKVKVKKEKKDKVTGEKIEVEVEETRKSKGIGGFFKAFKLGVDCSGYVNQVYIQWMLDHGKDKIEMVKTIGPNRDDLQHEINDKDICRDNCVLLKEEKVTVKGKEVKYSLYHIGYIFLNTYLNNEKIKLKEKGKLKTDNILDNNKNYKRNGPRDYSEDGNFNSKAAEAAVKSKLKAGDLICLEHNTDNQIAHYVIVEKTGINEQGQWYFCVTESTTAKKKSWIYSEGKREKNTEEWDGVRHNQGYYTSIKEFINTRESGYEFFWFCRPKAIVEYYDNNTIIEYKEEEKKKS